MKAKEEKGATVVGSKDKTDKGAAENKGDERKAASGKKAAAEKSGIKAVDESNMENGLGDEEDTDEEAGRAKKTREEADDDPSCEKRWSITVR